jgi:hypothetical protein
MTAGDDSFVSFKNQPQAANFDGHAAFGSLWMESSGGLVVVLTGWKQGKMGN